MLLALPVSVTQVKMKTSELTLLITQIRHQNGAVPGVRQESGESWSHLFSFIFHSSFWNLKLSWERNILGTVSFDKLLPCLTMEGIFQRVPVSGGYKAQGKESWHSLSLTRGFHVTTVLKFNWTILWFNSSLSWDVKWWEMLVAHLPIRSPTVPASMRVCD